MQIYLQAEIQRLQKTAAQIIRLEVPSTQPSSACVCLCLCLECSPDFSVVDAEPSL